MKIEVKRKIDIRPEELQETPVKNPYYFGVNVMETNTAYASNDTLRLVQQYSAMVASDVFGKYWRRVSDDNGKSWNEPEIIYEAQKTAEGTLRWNEGCLFLDEKKNKLLHFNNYGLYPEALHSADVGKYIRIFVKISSDNGETFSESRQIIQKGHDKDNWAEGVRFGRNSMYISFPAPLKLKNGKILLPVCKHMNEIKPETNGFMLSNKAGCLIGNWQGDILEWEQSEMVTLDPSVSSRGLCEPTFAELANGNIMMVMRGSNSDLNNVPGYRWYSISRDGGYTWTPPEPWCYDSGENFFSPASGSRFIRHSCSDKLYWIGNITKENPDGNIPRRPLIIAEVDEAKGALIKESVSAIDDKRPEDSPAVTLSNFRVYEDRISHEIVLNMSRVREKGWKNRNCPSYQYRIAILNT